MQQKYYLKIVKASDLKDKKERIFFRFLEILPAAFSWGTLILFIFLSWQAPIFVAFFIIAFDLYWFIRITYFSFHLRAGYKRMKEAERIDWLKKLASLDEFDSRIFANLRNWRDIYHLAVFAMYKEPLEIVRESFKALEKTDYPKDRMIVVLATEERGGAKDRATAELIEKEFGKNFFRFLITSHPKDLPNEIAGKGSNETFAVKKAKEKIIDHLRIPYENVIFSSLDADTVVFPKYFSCLTYYYLTAKKPIRNSYQPTPLFVNNIWEAPIFSRVFAFSSTFWHTMNQERPEKLITFSSHSMSFKALVDIGFKLPNVVSDDSRVFWQCFFYYDGDYQVLPIYYPLAMDAIAAATFLRTLKNLYKQQRRWAYGVGEIPYFIFGLFKNKKIPFRKKISFGLELLESHWSWAIAPILIFLLGWLPIILGGQAFNQTLLAYNLPRFTSYILTVAMIGIIASVYFSLLLLPPRPPKYGRGKYLVFVLQWIILPLSIIFFSALPALDAQTRWLLGKYMGFWPTEKIRKNF